MTVRQLKVYNLLCSGKHSVIGIMQHLHIGDPRSTIRDLRKQGFKVCDEWRETVDGGRYKLYWIDG